jgi:hypothetical protein
MGYVAMTLVVVFIVYTLVRDIIFRTEERDRRERWALREKLYPKEQELDRQKRRLEELERTLSNNG